MIRILLILALFISSSAWAKTQFTEDFSDQTTGYFSNGESDDWYANYCTFSYSCQIVDSPGRHDGSSWLGTFQDADCEDAHDTYGDPRPYTGDELRSTKATLFDNYDSWSSVRMYFNSNNFGTDTEDTTIIQLHATPDPTEAYRNPPSQIEWDLGSLKLSAKACNQVNPTAIMTGNGYCNTSKNLGTPPNYTDGWALKVWKANICTGCINLDEWNDIIMLNRIDYDGTGGLIKIWVNGTLEYSSSGHALGYNDSTTGSYWKFGMYNYWCSGSKWYRELYVDEVRVCYDDATSNCDDVCDVLLPGGIVPSGYSCD